MTIKVKSMLRKVFLPYAQVDLSNPVLQHEWKRLPRLKNSAHVKRFSLLIWISFPFIALLIFFVGQTTLPEGFSKAFIAFLTWMSLIPLVMASLTSLPMVIGTMNKQFQSDYWNTLRLTTQSNNDILMAFDASFQLRLWPFVVVEVGLRLSIFIVFIAAVITNITDQTHTIYPPLLNPLTIAAWTILPLVAIAFFLEPIMRSRLIIALHMLTGLRVRNAPFAILLGAITLLAIQLAHLVLFDGLWIVIQSVANGDSGSPITLMCLGPVALFAGVTFWILYISIRNTALAHAYEIAFRQD